MTHNTPPVVRLMWPGKEAAAALADSPCDKQLKRCAKRSMQPQDSANLLIEGDNLDGLKLLQAEYQSRVKLIYIDPPYNTGKQYVYKDAFGAAGGHVNWLNFIYPRLILARRLLRDDGVIFISIDDGEVANLRKLGDEVFGEENFVANIVWQKKYTRANDARWLSDNHDHLLCFAKNKHKVVFNRLPRSQSQLKAYKNPDCHPKGVWKATPLHAKSGQDTRPFTFQNGVRWQPPAGTYRRFADSQLRQMEANDEIWFGHAGRGIPARKSFLCDVQAGVIAVTLWPHDEVGHTHEANNELKKLGLGGLFDNPKPTRLIRRMLSLCTEPEQEHIVLDFFAGSGSTADAVIQQNLADGGRRRYILVQSSEPCGAKSAAKMAGYSLISDLTQERIRKALELAKQLGDESSALDLGFCVMQIQKSPSVS